MFGINRRKLLSSVKFSKGLKSLAGLEAWINHTETYNVVIHYNDRAQADYMYNYYVKRYCNSLYKIDYHQFERRTSSGQILVGKTGLFRTTKEISLHSLLKELVENERMVVLAGKERIVDKYQLEDSRRLEAGVAAMMKEIKEMEKSTREM